MCESSAPEPGQNESVPSLHTLSLTSALETSTIHLPWHGCSIPGNSTSTPVQKQSSREDDASSATACALQGQTGHQCKFQLAQSPLQSMSFFADDMQDRTTRDLTVGFGG